MFITLPAVIFLSLFGASNLSPLSHERAWCLSVGGNAMPSTFVKDHKLVHLIENGAYVLGRRVVSRSSTECSTLRTQTFFARGVRLR